MFKKLFFLIVLFCFSFCSFSKATTITNDFATTILTLSDTETGIPPSHYGHPGYNNLAFLYDVSVNAMMLYSANCQEEAEQILDYFAKNLSIDASTIRLFADSNNVTGLLKKMTEDANVVGLVNAFNVNAIDFQGRGQLEFYTTPGPVSFLLLAFLHVNSEKYLFAAEKMGHALLMMQREDGGIIDGDRNENVVNTEPHVDAANAFLQLYRVTGDPLWLTSGLKAIEWFKNNVYNQDTGEIYQGKSGSTVNTIFATDVYSWTLAGAFASVFSIEEHEQLVQTLLNKSLCKITFRVPGHETRTAVLVDFTDSRTDEVVIKRGGFHPLGSPEWAGGVILALQKFSARLYLAGQVDKASHYKAISEFLLAEVLKTSYRVDNMLMFCYATGQGIEVGHGWKTPYYFTEDFEGGSLIGGWPIMPLNGFNPFILNDKYSSIYDKIPFIKLEDYEVRCSYTENSSVVAPQANTQIVEPGEYNKNAWEAFNKFDYKGTLYWTKFVLRNKNWIKLAESENKKKGKSIGGLINYPWGTIHKNNNHQVHREIMKYPLLNEIATAMWLHINSCVALGREIEAEFWIRRLVTRLNLHQIPSVSNGLIYGYWNALVSWQGWFENSELDVKVMELIKSKKIFYEVPSMICVGK